MSSDRICQFFLRGRCQREKCEFRHPADKLAATSGISAAETASASKPEESSVAQTEVPKESENESLVTEKAETEQTEDNAPDDSEKPAASVEQQTEEPSKEKEDAEESEKVKEVTTEKPAEKAEAKKSIKETSTFIASSAAEVEITGTPVLLRRVAKKVDKDKEPPQEETSKGSEDFEDNLSEEESLVEKENDKNDKKKQDNSDPNKKTVAEISKDWDEEGDSSAEAEETIESIVNFIQDDSAAAPAKEASKETPQTNGGGDQGDPEKAKEWVTLVFGEDGKEIPQDKQQPAAPAGAAEKSVYDLDVEDDEKAAADGSRFSSVKKPKQRKRDNLAKKEGITRLGNNVYYYTGEKNDELEEEDEDDEDFDVELEEEDDSSSKEDEEPVKATPSETPKRGRSYAHGRRKHSTNYVYGAKSTAAKTRRCGECEGCNREDCGECPACIDKPKFGGKGLKKQACVHRVCTWKNPDGKKGSGRGTPKTGTPGTPASARGRGRPRKDDAADISMSESLEPVSEIKEPVPPKPVDKKKRRSISVISPAAVKERPNDKDLPPFDPSKFKPGVPPPVVKKGEEEYHIIVSGVKDTGLTGRYWADVETLPSKRKRVSLNQFQSSPAPSPTGRGRREKVSESSSTKETPAAETTSENQADNSNVVGTKRKSTKEAQPQDAKKKKVSPAKKSTKLSNGTEVSEPDANVVSNPPEDKPATEVSTSSATRGVSCLTDQSSQKEVIVECFAPYDDHRWVNIGKERDGMRPDAVQYARALRPPYHLLSFLRIKGNSTKGMSCTDKNTMVFVVLEGEISVVLHTTEFNAKKGDSFYIPPKNYYNLINKKAREAELSLIQFQYDGPLPTVSAGSQSGATKPATNSAPQK